MGVVSGVTTQAYCEPTVWPLQTISIHGKVFPVYGVYNPLVLEFIVGPYRTQLETSGRMRLMDRKGRVALGFTRVMWNTRAMKLEVVQ